MKYAQYGLILASTLVILLIPLVIFLVKFDNVSPLGHLLKNKIITFPFLVKAINLNEPGDGRTAYIRDSYPNIVVNLYFDKNAYIDPHFTSWLQEMIFKTTGKTATVNKAKLPLNLAQTSYTETDLKVIKTNYLVPSKNPATLSIVYLTSFQDHPSYAGITRDRDLFFIFSEAIITLTTNLEERSLLEQSTLMHEWAHILGLNHNDFKNCIMSSTIEIDQNVFQKNSIVTEYCWNELYELDQIRRMVNEITSAWPK